MSALEIFRGFPTTKADITAAVRNIKEEILSGDYSALEIDLHLKKMEEVVKGIRDDKEVKSAVLSELEKYPEKTIKNYGCEITKTSRSTYDYDLCNDIVLQDLEREFQRVSEALKDRQKFLQGIRESLVVVTDDGSIDTIYPPAKKSSETFSIKIL